MNFKQIEAFQAVMLSGSTTAAARRLGLSQSAVSRLLGQFEDSLGLVLFERRGGRLIATREAESLGQDAGRLVELAQCFARHAQQLRVAGFRRRLLNVVVPSTMATKIMPPVLERFARDHPDLSLEVRTGSYGFAERAVLSRDADLALTLLPTQHADLRAEPCLETEAVCVLPCGHPLASLEAVTPADLDQVPMVLLGRQHAMREDIDMVLRQTRARPRIVAEVHSVAVACSIVAQGMGVSIVNALLASYCRDPAIVRRPFRPRIPYTLGFISLAQSQPDPLHAAFAECLVDTVMERVLPEDLTTCVFRRTQAESTGPAATPT